MGALLIKHAQFYALRVAGKHGKVNTTITHRGTHGLMATWAQHTHRGGALVGTGLVRVLCAHMASFW